MARRLEKLKERGEEEVIKSVTKKTMVSLAIFYVQK